MLFLRSIRLRFAAVALAATGCLCAQDVRPDISGDSLRIDLGTKRLVYSGHVRVVQGDIVLTADEIRYDETAKDLEATGHLVLQRGASRLLAESGSFNLQTRALRAARIRLGQYPVYLNGESAAGTLDEFTVTDAQVFFREDAGYTPSFTARSLTYAQGRIIAADGVRLGLHASHFLHLPRFSRRLDADLASNVSARLGYRHNLGAILQAGLHVPVADGFNLGADAGLYTSRGLMLGPSGGYARSSPEATIEGGFRSGYIHDYGDRKTDLFGRPVPADRQFATWWHRQQIGSSLALDGRFNYWSDSEILRDFRPREFFPDQQPDSFLQGTYTGGNYVLNAIARVHPNRFHRVQERLPEIRFDYLPTPLVAGIVQQAAASVAVLEEDAYQAAPAGRSTRFDAYYGLTRPVALAPWFTFAPVAGGRVTGYGDAIGGRSSYERRIGEIGFDARLLASGAFDYRNEAWEIDGLRHLIVPELSYRYAPQAGRGRPYIPAIDRRAFATYLQPLSIADTRNIDDLQRLDTLRLAFRNTLQTRDKVYGSRDLASLDFATDYWFTRADNGAGRKGVSDLHTALSVTPAPWLRFAAYHRFDPHRPSTREFNTAVELVDREWWSLKLATHFLKSDYEEYSLDYRQRLNETWDIVGLWRYDATNSRFTEQTYGLWQRLGQTWALKYEVSFFEGPRRESSFAFNLEVELMKF